MVGRRRRREEEERGGGGRRGGNADGSAGNVSDTSGHSHVRVDLDEERRITRTQASSERKDDDENPSTRRKERERRHWSDSEGGDGKEPSLMHKLKRFGLGDRKEAEAAQEQEQSRRTQLEGRQGVADRMPALVGGKLLLAPTRKGEGEGRPASKPHTGGEKERKSKPRPSSIDHERDLGAWGSQPRAPTAADPSRIWTSDEGGGGSDLSEYPWRERDRAHEEPLEGRRGGQRADSSAYAAGVQGEGGGGGGGGGGGSSLGSPRVPAELGKFNLSRISVREDGREDAFARTSALLMDHEAPIPTQNATFWNRLF
eukprot:767172-Hanusia_phi.AAC.2